MSRDWQEHKYCNAENLWGWIDEQSTKTERNISEAFEWKSDSYRMLSIGRKEMLERLADWLHENETTLGDVAGRWGLKQKEED